MKKGRLVKEKNKKFIYVSLSIPLILVIIAVSIVIINSRNESTLSGKALAQLNPEQNKAYWQCMKEKGCSVLLQEAQKTKNFNAYRTCSLSCYDQASKFTAEALTCNDTDGTDFLTKGIVYTNFEPKGKEDYCYTFPGNSINYLMEGTCKNNKYAYLQNDCGEMGDYECKEGKCIEKNFCFNKECKSKKLDFIIVTRPMFVESLGDFAKWKKEKFGFNVGVFTLEWIESNFEGENIILKVKKAIHSVKKEKTFALLVGDTEVATEPLNWYDGSIGEDVTPETLQQSSDLTQPWNVPTTGFFKMAENNPNFIEALEVSDLPFTDEEDKGYVWIKSIDIGPGFYEEGYKFNPSVYLGRWPVRTTAELSNIINKTIYFHSIGKFVFTMDSSFGSSQCLGWPINYKEQFQETYCYEDVFNTTYNSLFPNIPNEYIVVNTSSESEAISIKNKIISTPENNAVIETFHGNECSLSLGLNTWLNSKDEFTSSFPLMAIYSCSIAAFYLNINCFGLYSDSYAESMLKSKNGPVIIAQPFHSYSFYKEILNHKTIGEAFYSSTDILIHGNLYWLLGDPSLVLYQS